MKKNIALKKIMHLPMYLILATLMVSGLTACQDDAQQPDAKIQEDIELAENSTLSEAYSEEDVSFSYLAAQEITSEGGKMTNNHLACAVITHNKETNVITVDFGESCIGPYGRERSGKIIITYGGAFDDHFANRVITFDDYYVNNRQITGSIELRDINRNEDGFITATRKLVDYTLHFPNGTTYVANGSITREWIEGEGDNDPRTNVIRITGSYEGVSSRGRVHTIEIVEPVIASFPCRGQGGFLRIAGLKEIRISNETAERIRSVYFGNGTCDNEITVTINGRTFTITEE